MERRRRRGSSGSGFSSHVDNHFVSSSPWSSSSGRGGEGSKENPIRRAVFAFRSCFGGEPERDIPKGTRRRSSESDDRFSYNLVGIGAKGSRRSISSDPREQRQTQIGNMKFSLRDIHEATKNFSSSFKIGQGGFGTVYKGKLSDGTLVAIKRAKRVMYDNHLNVEFRNEIQTLASVEHLNLVRFLGYLEEGGERIVVVEYIPNGTLREHLDGLRGETLDFSKRLDILIDVAHAITYLHMFTDRPIIHRDIKSSNILLTENLRAKVADFGFARFAPTDMGATHVSTQVKGTAGYLDPEYLVTYQLTEKSDVYSFGVLITEVVSGRRAVEPKEPLKERITSKWAVEKCYAGNAVAVLDSRLTRNSATCASLQKIMELAVLCLAPRRQNRPSMKTCGEILWNIRKSYQDICSNKG